MEHPEEAPNNLALNLNLNYEGKELLPMLTPEFVTTVPMELSDITYSICNSEEDPVINKNLYFVFGQLSGLAKGLDQALNAVFDPQAGKVIKHNRDTVIALRKIILNKLENDYPTYAIARMYNDNGEDVLH